jgi:hypothetical protein
MPRTRPPADELDALGVLMAGSFCPMTVDEFVTAAEQYGARVHRSQWTEYRRTVRDWNGFRRDRTGPKWQRPNGPDRAPVLEPFYTSGDHGHVGVGAVPYEDFMTGLSTAPGQRPRIEAPAIAHFCNTDRRAAVRAWRRFMILFQGQELTDKMFSGKATGFHVRGVALPTPFCHGMQISRKTVIR